MYLVFFPISMYTLAKTIWALHKSFMLNMFMFMCMIFLNFIKWALWKSILSADLPLLSYSRAVVLASQYLIWTIKTFLTLFKSNDKKKKKKKKRHKRGESKNSKRLLVKVSKHGWFDISANVEIAAVWRTIYLWAIWNTRCSKIHKIDLYQVK